MKNSKKSISIGFIFENGEEDVRNAYILPLDSFQPDVFLWPIKPDRKYGWVIIRTVEREKDE